MCLCEYCLEQCVWLPKDNGGCTFLLVRIPVVSELATVTSGVDDQVNVIVAWHCCSMSQRTSLVYLTDVEITKVSLSQYGRRPGERPGEKWQQYNVGIVCKQCLYRSMQF